MSRSKRVIDILFGIVMFLAGAAFLFLEYNIRRNQGVMLQYSDDNEDVVATDRLLRKIVFYCVTISIVSISQSVYNIINTKLLLIGLKNVGYSTEAIFNITNNTTQLVPKICIIVISLSTAMTSSIALLESAVSTFEDEFHIDRHVGTIIMAVVMVGIGTLSCLGYGPLSFFTIIGMQFLDFFDFLTNSVMMPISAISICVLCLKVIGIERIAAEVTKKGAPFRRKKVYEITLRYFCIICLVIILLTSIAQVLGIVTV